MQALQKNTLALVATLVLAFAAASCGDDNGNPIAPSNPGPTPAPAVSLSGSVTSGGQGVSGATVSFLDGPNAGRSTTTSGSGSYSFSGIQGGNANLSATAPGFNEDRRGVTIAGQSTLSFTLERAAPFSRSGQGNDVFDKPAYVTRVRITGRFDGGGQNFIMWCGNSLLVNEILGTRWPATSYEGVHATSNCTQIRVENSTGVQWSMTEVR